MHLYRLLLPVALVGALTQPVAAADDWFERQFVPADRVAPVLAVRSRASTPVRVDAATTSGWRTVVFPSKPIGPSTNLARSGFQPVSNAAPAAFALTPLTGYAHELSGLASYYWQEQMTSSGERFDRHGLTAAHKTLPLGTRVRVTNLANGKSAVVRINDRGPFKGGRVIDLSEAAALQINMTGPGIARVAIDVVP